METYNPDQEVADKAIRSIVRQVMGPDLYSREDLRKWWTEISPEIRDGYRASYQEGNLRARLIREKRKQDG